VETWAIVVAAGAGSRFGGAKQFELLGDRRVLDRALDGARAVADGIVLVVPPGHARVETADVVAIGGATRSASVRAGLLAVPTEADIVVIHDAVRPLAPVSLFQAVVEAVRAGADGAVPGVPVPDTVKRVRGDRVAETLDRSQLVAVQTPQAFAAAVLRRAHETGAEASDDAALVEDVGGRVVVVPGDPRNAKITTPADLVAARALLDDA
jgi:2-C-methyl-D-erythritol 4-phosphate cytidylyltransferase